MSDERREILKMLADKVITVDEAERLLKALNEGEQKRTADTGGPLPGADPNRGGRPGFGPFSALNDMLSGIGPMVSDIIHDSLANIPTTIGFNEDGDADGDREDENDLEELRLTEGRLTIENGFDLTIRVRRRPGITDAGRLELLGAVGDQCEIVAGHPRAYKVFKGRRRIHIVTDDESLTVKVPPSVARVRATMQAGSIYVVGVPTAVKLRTMGGNLHLRNMSKTFEAKTMGGNLEIGLAPDWQGECRAHTMGGNIRVAVAPGANGEIRAVTMGGAIEAGPEVGRITYHRGLMPRKATVLVGDGNPATTLQLKTMGGFVRIDRETATAAQSTANPAGSADSQNPGGGEAV